MERRGGGGVGISRKGKDADGVDSTVCCGLRGEKRREAGEALRLQLQLLLLRLPSKVPICAKKIQVFESRRKKHTKKDKNSSCWRKKHSKTVAPLLFEGATT